jgi:murein L,D-transpeptidase YcbB/YkuD
METSISTVGKKQGNLTAIGTATVHLLQRVAALTIRYSYWFLSVLIFFSCQKNLTQTEPASNEAVLTTQSTTVSEEKPISIDTLHHSLTNRISMVSQKDTVVAEKMEHKLKSFYIANALNTKWLGETAPHALYFALMAQFNTAANYGLNTNDYNTGNLEERVYLLYRSKQPAKSEIIELDMNISEMFFLFATHLRDGRITETGHTGNIWIRENKNDTNTDLSLLVQTKNSNQLAEVIGKLQPAHPQYARLQNALAVYLSLESSFAKFPAMNGSEKIKPGDKHAAIPMIRKKISLTNISTSTTRNDSSALTMDSLLYDQDLAIAVKAFQERHGLEPDGVIGGSTSKFLNRSFREIAEVIALNMERLRWLPAKYADHCFTVNIPEYKLRIFENQKQTLEMKVIVGALHSPTPVFHDTLEHVVFSPTWTVPTSIMKTEIFPRLRKNPAYYSNRDFTFYKNGVEIDPSMENLDSAFNINQYRVVQKPGAYNSLGLVKFAMPNSMNIYLHDTPDHTLFSKSFRALSHGCVRLDDPSKFAAYLLQEDKSWTLPSIQKAMKASKPVKVVLAKQYSVHLEYQTAWVDANGAVHFREDIYGHDKKQLQQLKSAKKATQLASL